MLFFKKENYQAIGLRHTLYPKIVLFSLAVNLGKNDAMIVLQEPGICSALVLSPDAHGCIYLPAAQRSQIP